MTWITGASAAGSKAPVEASTSTAAASSQSNASLRQSASFLRLTAASDRSRDSIRWGWSRSETARLVRMQAVVRGWLLRRKACRIPARDVEAVLKDLNQKDKGLRRLVGYLIFILLFYGIVSLETDVSFQYAVETGLRAFVDSVGTGPEDLRVNDLATRQDFKSWATSFYLALYDGTEVEDVCNACAFARSPVALDVFPDTRGLWGTAVTIPGTNGTASSSVLFEFDNCPVCYDAEGSAIVSGSTEGETFCAMCSGLHFCFEDACSGYDVPRATIAEVKGTDTSMVRSVHCKGFQALKKGENPRSTTVKVETSADCPVSLGAGSFLKEYGATVGFTGAWADFMIESTLFNASSSTSGSPMGSSLDVGKDGPVLEPNGSGYVANKNRIVGVVICSWTYYESQECADQQKVDFYSPCYKDSGSYEDRMVEIDASLSNRLGSVISREEPYGAGREYSLTIDGGVYNMGLNQNLCAMLAVLEGDAIIDDAVRTLSLQFNTYNGQGAGLFSAVEISASFSLGGELQITPSVNVFPLSPFTEATRTSEIAIRNGLMLLFALMLSYYVVHDLRRLWRELKDGRKHFNFRTRKAPIATATLLYIWADMLFVVNVCFWVKAAVTASRFELEPTLRTETATTQAIEVGEELETIGVSRWEQKALIVAGSMLGLARLFLLLRFHPRLSLVTDVLTASAVHLVHFFIMFFAVVAVYSNVGWIIFGPSSDLFSTWVSSFITMTRTALGEFDNIYPKMIEINPDAAFIIIATYQTLQFILLLNIVISILLDAFQSVQERNALSHVDTLMETVMSTLGRWRIRSVNKMCGVFGRGRCHRSGRRRSLGTMNPLHDPVSRSTRWRRSVQQRERQHRHNLSTSVDVNGCLPTTQGDPTPASLDVGIANHAGALPNTVGPPLPLDSGRRRQRWRWSTAVSRAEKGRRAPRAGLTRAERIQASNRHYDIKTAAEVLRRSPLPEKAVWRKMRQIVGARLGWTVTDCEPGGWGAPTMTRASSRGSVGKIRGGGNYAGGDSSTGYNHKAKQT